MPFNEPIFLFSFLPLALALYYAIPARWSVARNASLLLASLIFYAWAGGASVFFILAMTLVNMAAGVLIERQRERSDGRGWLIAAIALNLLVLGLCKYSRFLVENVNAVLAVVGAQALPLPPMAQPPGISFFTFVAIAYLVEVYRGGSAALRDPIQVGLHLLFFSRILAGPIVRPADVAGELARRAVSREQFADGVRRFLIGLGKKVLIASTLAEAADRVFAIPTAELRPAVAWLGAVCYMGQIYFDFSGYTDMAIGLGAMFGFRFPENFQYPYTARSVREFWRRWHMTLSSWLRDYLYIPLGGSRCRPSRVYLNLLIVFLLCGLWHGARWTFVVWGLFHGTFLILERLGWEKFLQTSSRLVGHAYLLLVLLVSWVFFRSETLSQAFGYLAAMTGLTTPTGVQDGLIAHLNPHLVVVLGAAVLGSMPVLPALRRWWGAQRWHPDWLDPLAGLVGPGLLLLLSLLAVAASTHTPFIYSQF